MITNNIQLFISPKNLPLRDTLENSIKVPYSIITTNKLTYNPLCTRIGLLWNNDYKMFPFGTTKYNILFQYFTKELIEYLNEYKKKIIVDLITCSLGDKQFKDEITRLKKIIPHVTFNYSINKTGSTINSDWIMESSGESIANVYFNKNIVKYNASLDLAFILPPSSFGYTNKNFNDITNTGTQINFNDTISSLLDIGFSFNLNGIEYNKFSINKYGILTLNTEAPIYNQSPIDILNDFNLVIMPLYDINCDILNVSAYYEKSLDEATDIPRIIRIQWNVNTTKIQVILYKYINKIEFIYENATALSNIYIGIAWKNNEIKKYYFVNNEYRIYNNTDPTTIDTINNIALHFYNHVNNSQTQTNINISNYDLSYANFSCANLTGSNLSNANLIETIFTRTIFDNTNIQNVTFYGKDLTGCDFKYADLTGSKFIRCVLTDTEFINANLTNVELDRNILIQTQFDGATMKGVIFKGISLNDIALEGIDLSDVIIERSDLNNTIISNCDFTNAIIDNITIPTTITSITESIFTNANLTGIDLSNKILSNNDFRDATLINVNFSASDLNNTIFTNANLHNANLNGVDLSGKDLSGCNLTNINLQSVILQNTNFSGADLTNQNLSNLDLSGINLTNARLNGVTFSGSSLVGANVSGLNLTNINLADIPLQNTSFVNSILTNQNLVNKNLTSCEFRDANLTNVNLQYATLTNTNFYMANLEGINLQYATLVGANLTSQNLIRTELIGAILKRSILTNTNLTNKNLSGYDLSGCYFNDAILLNTNIQNSNLTGAYLYNQTLTNIDLTGTILKNSDLSNTNLAYKNLSNKDLSNCNFENANMNNVILNNSNLTNANLLNANIRNIILHGANLTNTNFTNQNLTEIDFTNTNTSLIRTNLTGTNLIGVNFSRKNLTSCIMNDANVQNININDSNLTNASFNRCNLTGVNFTNTTLFDTKFVDANLSNVKLSNKNLTNCDFSGANINTTNISNATINNVKFIGTDLRNLNLTSRNLTGCNFNNSQLPNSLFNANLSSTILINQNLTNVNIENISLVNANLNNAILTNKDLTSVNLFGTILTNVNLSNSILTNKDLSYKNLVNCNFINATLTNAKLHHSNLANSKLNSLDLTNYDLSDCNLNNAELTDTNISYSNISRTRFTTDQYPINYTGPTETLMTKNDTLNDILIPTPNIGNYGGELIYRIGDINEGRIVSLTDTITNTDTFIVYMILTNSNSPYLVNTYMNAIITPKSRLTIEDIAINDKIYDSTINATLRGNVYISGIEQDHTNVDITRNSLSVTFNDKNVGIDKPTNINGCNLIGSDAEYYTLILPTLRANIEKQDVSIRANIASKRYDGYISIDPILIDFKVNTKYNQDNVNVNYISAQYDNPNIGTRNVTINGISLEGNDSTNYNVTTNEIIESGIITAPKTLIFIDSTVYITKTYDGKINTSVNLQANNISPLDDVQIKYLTCNFENKNVGINKNVGVTGIYISGTDKNNYVLDDSSRSITLKGSIIPRQVNITNVTAMNKSHDGTNVAIIKFGDMQNIISGDDVILNQSGIFESAGIGENINVTSTCYITGTSSNNYSIIQPNLNTANIYATNIDQTENIIKELEQNKPQIVIFKNNNSPKQLIANVINDFSSNIPRQIGDKFISNTYDMKLITNTDIPHMIIACNTKTNAYLENRFGQIELYYLNLNDDKTIIQPSNNPLIVTMKQQPNTTIKLYEYKDQIPYQLISNVDNVSSYDYKIEIDPVKLDYRKLTIYKNTYIAIETQFDINQKEFTNNVLNINNYISMPNTIINRNYTSLNTDVASIVPNGDITFNDYGTAKINIIGTYNNNPTEMSISLSIVDKQHELTNMYGKIYDYTNQSTLINKYGAKYYTSTSLSTIDKYGNSYNIIRLDNIETYNNGLRCNTGIVPQSYNIHEAGFCYSFTNINPTLNDIVIPVPKPTITNITPYGDIILDTFSKLFGNEYNIRAYISDNVSVFYSPTFKI